MFLIQISYTLIFVSANIVNSFFALRVFTYVRVGLSPASFSTSGNLKYSMNLLHFNYLAYKCRTRASFSETVYLCTKASAPRGE